MGSEKISPPLEIDPADPRCMVWKTDPATHPTKKTGFYSLAAVDNKTASIQGIRRTKNNSRR